MKPMTEELTARYHKAAHAIETLGLPPDTKFV